MEYKRYPRWKQLVDSCFLNGGVPVDARIGKFTFKKFTCFWLNITPVHRFWHKTYPKDYLNLVVSLSIVEIILCFRCHGGSQVQNLPHRIRIFFNLYVVKVIFHCLSWFGHLVPPSFGFSNLYGSTELFLLSIQFTSLYKTLFSKLISEIIFFIYATSSIFTLTYR